MAETCVGQPRTRVDGVEKVTGRAMYAGDVRVPGMVYAALVQSTIARGTIEAIETAEAEGAPGVVAVYTHANLPPVKAPPEDFTKDFPAERRAPLSDAVIHYAGQHVALVLAETQEQAQAAAGMVRVRYTEETPVLELREGMEGTYKPDHFATNSEEHLQSERGKDVATEFRVKVEYRTPVLTHNPIEPYATVAVWEGERLTLYDSTRWVQGSRKIAAAMLGIGQEQVRVVTPFVGGAFGSKGFIWQHVALAAKAARTCGRPVKLVLSREEMFTSIGHRPRTVQRLELGAKGDGSLQALEHRTLSETSPVAHFVEPAGMTSRNLYRTRRVVISHEVSPTNLATPCFMRAPGESPGMFALECAMDELAERLGMDPVELRLRNYAEKDEEDRRPWSSKHLRECYRIGAERFGWGRRLARVGAMRRGEKLVGWGMATAAYPGRRSPVTVRAVMGMDGVARFSAATHEIGGGTATVMEQIAADALEVPVERVRFVLGDSAMPEAPVAGASQTTASVGSAVHEAAVKLRTAMAGGQKGEVAVEVTAKLDDKTKKKYTFQSFGAHFAEVEVDRVLGEVKVTRWVSVIDGGRVLNRMGARSQIMGGVIFGLGMALMERTMYDPRVGAPVNASLGEYLVPTCADIPEIDVSFVEEPDTRLSPLGNRGIGEIGITGVPAAVANAVWHATGVRVRELPITPEKLMQG